MMYILCKLTIGYMYDPYYCITLSVVTSELLGKRALNKAQNIVNS